MLWCTTLTMQHDNLQSLVAQALTATSLKWPCWSHCEFQTLAKIDLWCRSTFRRQFLRSILKPKKDQSATINGITFNQFQTKERSNQKRLWPTDLLVCGSVSPGRSWRTGAGTATLRRNKDSLDAVPDPTLGNDGTGSAPGDAACSASPG